jgi:hypothetical protein
VCYRPLDKFREYAGEEAVRALTAAQGQPQPAAAPPGAAPPAQSGIRFFVIAIWAPATLKTKCWTRLVSVNGATFKTLFQNTTCA